MMADLVRTVATLGGDPSVAVRRRHGRPARRSARAATWPSSARPVAEYAAYCGSYKALALAVRDLPFPLIAAVNGAAVAGGFELMCLCDLRVAADDATILTGDAALGLPTTSGLSWLLPRLVGDGRARWLTMVEPRLSGAARRTRSGLVEEVRPAGGGAGAGGGDGGDRRRQAGRRHPAHAPHVRRVALETHEQAIAAELAAQREGFAHPSVRQAFGAFFAR